jgi:anthranilate phosphoribosyltransferase
MGMSGWQALLDGQLSEAESLAKLRQDIDPGAELAELLTLHQLLSQRAVPWPDAPPLPHPLIDCCGTGGDGSQSLNVSTAVAFVVAAAGLAVAKHGGGAATSKSGSLNVLDALRVKLPTDAQQAAARLAAQTLVFLPAPLFHPAMRLLAPLRKQVGRPTIFNLLGPLLNPARPPFQLLGVYDAGKLMLMAQALQALGVEKAWVVHGQDGRAELSLGAPNQVLEVTPTGIRAFVLHGSDLGLPHHPKATIQGGDAVFNAAAMTRLLRGQAGAYRDTVLLNAAAALHIANHAPDLTAGLVMAQAAIDSGAALQQLTLTQQELADDRTAPG